MLSNALKNRLIGTVVLVALAVIFLPDFLDGKKETNDLVFESVPQIPDKKPIISPEPFPSQRVEQSTQRPIEIVSDVPADAELEQKQINQASSVPSGDAEEQSIESTDQADEQKRASASPDTDQDSGVDPSPLNNIQENNVPAGWVIQLGSFRHEKNVRLLIDKLKKAEYPVFSRPIETQSGTLTKVFVGPDLKRSKLESWIPKLKSLTGLNGEVTRFTVQP